MEDNKCPHCGATTKEYRHTMSKSLARCLALAAKAGERSFNPADYMNANQRANFQKLRYWELIEKVRDGDTRGKGGDWIITRKGWLFLSNQVDVHWLVWTFRGKRVRYEGETIKIKQVTGGWMYRGEYAEGSQAHG